MRVASWSVSIDEERERVRERDESQRLLLVAERVKNRTNEVADKVLRMTQLYQERLEGVRQPRSLR